MNPHIYAGGKDANQAVSAARMGARTARARPAHGPRTAMVGRVGDDISGPLLIDGLRAVGIDVSRVAVWPGETPGIAVNGIDGSAQNRIVQVLGSQRHLRRC